MRVARSWPWLRVRTRDDRCGRGRCAYVQLAVLGCGLAGSVVGCDGAHGEKSKLMLSRLRTESQMGRPPLAYTGRGRFLTGPTVVMSGAYQAGEEESSEQEDRNAGPDRLIHGDGDDAGRHAEAGGERRLGAGLFEQRRAAAPGVVGHIDRGVSRTEGWKDRRWPPYLYTRNKWMGG